MSSSKKIEANRRNAKASTGPRTAEGRAAVAGHALTHGLRASKALLYFENRAEFQRICRDLDAQWRPATPAESNLVEQMALAQAKLVHLEFFLAAAFCQSNLKNAGASRDRFTGPNGMVYPADMLVPLEEKSQRLINGLSQHIARVERAWFKALDTLQKLQDRRAKETAAPVHPVAHSEIAALPPLTSKNVDQSHRSGGDIPAKRGPHSEELPSRPSSPPFRNQAPPDAPESPA